MKTLQQSLPGMTALVLGSLLLAGGSASAADPASGIRPLSQKLEAADHGDWAQVIRNLDSDDYAMRETASQKLTHAGAGVVPMLCQAVQTGSPEVVWRGTKALEQIAIRGDEAALEAVVFAVQELAKQARPELAGMAADLRERQRWFRHQAALGRLRQSGAEVATMGEDGEIEDEAGIEFGGFIGGPIFIEEVDGLDEEVEGPVVAAEWEEPGEVMTLEDRAAMFAPIEVSFLDQFKAQAAKATALPAALEGWEDITVDDVAAWGDGFDLSDDRLPEAVPAEGVARALERIAILEREVAEDVEPAIPEEDIPLAIDEEPLMEAEVEVVELDFAPAFFAGEVMMQEEGAVAVQSSVNIDSRWKGGNEGIKDLAALEGQVELILRDAPLTDEALQHIGAIKQLTAFSIFGGDLSAEALLKFHREHPQVQLSARSNGWMGINAFGTPCQIENIVETSAAEEAGLKVGDVVLKVNGAAIKDFTELTLAMASQDAGDVVRVGIEREGKALEIPVKLHARP